MLKRMLSDEEGNITREVVQSDDSTTQGDRDNEAKGETQARLQGAKAKPRYARKGTAATK